MQNNQSRTQSRTHPTIDFKAIPKVELHVHLDCCLSLGVVSQLRPGITEEEYRADFIAPAKCLDLADFLKTTFRSIALMQTKENLRLVTRDLFQQFKADNVIYAEIRFAPLQHLDNGLTPAEVVQTVVETTDACVAETGVEAGILLCTLRHYSQAQSLQTAKLAEQFKGTRVVGLDIAADEAGFPVDAHIAAFDFARRNGIPRTAHAGEAKGPESVWETLAHFKPQRIGHGVRSIQDPKLIQALMAENILLEVCPTCNIQIDVFDTYPNHPVDKLYRAGVPISINTDTRTITDISLSHEYQRLHETFGWTETDFQTCNANALKAAFIQAALREKLLDRLRG